MKDSLRQAAIFIFISINTAIYMHCLLVAQFFLISNFSSSIAVQTNCINFVMIRYSHYTV